jgi:3-dehydroquinate dehydratase-2
MPMPETTDPATKPLRLLALHGPNLNTLGSREPHIYGSLTLGEINQRLVERGSELGCAVVCFQSNHEGALIDFLQEHGPTAQGLIINASGLTHTSVCQRDAVAGSGLMAVEVHLSNIHAREPFRHTSLLAEICRGQVVGLGWRGYLAALVALVGLLREQ